MYVEICTYFNCMWVVLKGRITTLGKCQRSKTVDFRYAQHSVVLHTVPDLHIVGTPPALMSSLNVYSGYRYYRNHFPQKDSKDSAWNEDTVFL